MYPVLTCNFRAACKLQVEQVQSVTQVDQVYKVLPDTYALVCLSENTFQLYLFIEQDQLCSVERDVCPILFTLLIHVPFTLYSAGYRNVS